MISKTHAISTLLFAFVSAAASAFSGGTIQPVIVCVTDTDGNLLKDAKVKIHSDGLAKALESSIDPDDPFRQRLTQATRSGTTNELGHALLHSYGRWSPSDGQTPTEGKNGRSVRVSGAIDVSASGFEPVSHSFNRTFVTRPQGQTELTLVIQVTIAPKK